MANHSSVPNDVPPFYGWVETTINALRLIHAARQGIIPRITRRLNDAERRTMIKSGAVFVFSVEESGIKRWTDGLLWSPSRIVGNFLVYREINERSNSRGSHKKLYPTEDPSRSSGRKNSPEHFSAGYKGLSSGHPSNDQGTFKANGLMKKTITVNIEGSDLHLITYYTSDDIRSGRLKKPTSRSDIMDPYMPPHIFRLTNFRVPPKVEIGADGRPHFVEEVEDLDDVDCKAEEQSYNIPASPTWGSDHGASPIEGSFAGTSLYPVSSQIHPISSSSYARGGTGNRFPISVDTLRMPPAVRQEIGWSSSPSPTHSSPTSTRRDGSFGGSWQNPASQRWQPFEQSSSNNSAMYVDRARSRAGNPYPPPLTMSHRRDPDALINPRYVGNVGESRENGSRLPWLLSEDANESRGDTRQSSSFTPPISQYSSQHYYRTGSQSYNSGWNANGGTANGHLHNSLPPFSSQGTFQSHGGSYATSSAGLSSPGSYSNADEYADS